MMENATVSTLLYYENVDDRLGPAEKRAFGAGFRRSSHTTGRVRVEGGRVEARAGVHYPADWSSKGGVDQLPHLSTVDVLVIGAQLAELAIARSHGLDAEQRGAMWLRDVRIRAGRVPLEEGLDDFAVSAVLVDTGDEDVIVPGFRISTVDAQVGPLRITCVVEHPPSAGTGAGLDAPGEDSLDVMLGDPGARYYGGGYRAVRTSVGALKVDRSTSGATATATVRVGDHPAGEGLDGFRQPSVSMIDCFVTGLQIGQVLLYELDAVDRAHSQTLWMRQTTWEVASPAPVRPGPVAVRAALENVRLLERAADDRWRTADITTRMAGLSMRCSVAHRLGRAG